jgi:hypothetical protein
LARRVVEKAAVVVSAPRGSWTAPLLGELAGSRYRRASAVAIERGPAPELQSAFEADGRFR